MVSAEFYTDPDLLRWPSAKRDLYRSMWALAEDSACIEDDPFGWKCAAWPSPLDAKTHSVAKFTAWRKELIEDGKAFEYEAAGGRFLFLPDMAEHEHPRNPQSPNLPLPRWVTWQPHATDLRKGSYVFDWALYNACTTVESGNLTVPALPGPVLSCPVDKTPVSSMSSGSQRTGRTADHTGDDPAGAIAYFEEKAGRPATADELSSVKRWVRDVGSLETTVIIGSVVESGVGLNMRIIGGRVKKSKQERSAS